MVTLTGWPAVAFLLWLVLCWTAITFVIVSESVSWLIDRHLDKVKARYKARFGKDFDPDEKLRADGP